MGCLWSWQEGAVKNGENLQRAFILTDTLSGYWTSWEAPPTQTMNLRSLNARTTRLSGLSAIVFICTLSVHVCVFVTIWFKLSSVILFYSTYYFNTGLENTFWFSFIFLTCWMSVNLFIHQLSLRSAKEAGLWLSLTLVASRNMHTLLLCTPSLLLVILPHLFIFCDVLVTLWCWLLLLSGHPMGTKHQFNCG